jgi:cytochrome c biogenesis protein CcdA
VNLPQHYNPLLVTVLPKERRSRHSYQLGAMMCLFTLGLWQLVVGAAAASSINTLDRASADLLNWVCIVAGGAGVLAAVIPERIVRLRLKVWRWILRTEFDATYFRLWEEFGAHLLLLSVWMAYGQTVWTNYGLVKGYSLGLAAAVWFGWAALARAWQIMLTLYRSGTFTRKPSAVVGDGEIDLTGAV